MKKSSTSAAVSLASELTDALRQPHDASAHSETFRLYPTALDEHVSCSRYLDHSQLKFQHLLLTPETAFDPGRTETCMILFVLSGTCRVESSECDDSVDLRADEMIFVVAGSCFTAHGAPACGCLLLRFTEFSFCEMLTLQNLAQEIAAPRPQFEPFPVAPPLRSFLRGMTFYTDNNVNCSHLQQIKQDECFILMRLCYPKAELARIFAPLLYDKEIVLRMKIQRFAARTHSLAELAARCEMTEITMKRKIRKFFGLSPYQWMLRQRNRQILFDLRSGRTPKEICYSYAFTSLGNFATYCKRQFGLPPTQIKALSQEDYAELQRRLPK